MRLPGSQYFERIRSTPRDGPGPFRQRIDELSALQRSYSCCRHSTSAVARSDRRRLLGDVDADRAPGDASTASHTARGLELIPPCAQLVGHPLAVAAAHGGSYRAAVNERKVA